MNFPFLRYLTESAPDHRRATLAQYRVDATRNWQSAPGPTTPELIKSNVDSEIEGYKIQAIEAAHSKGLLPPEVLDYLDSLASNQDSDVCYDYDIDHSDELGEPRVSVWIDKESAMAYYHKAHAKVSMVQP